MDSHCPPRRRRTSRTVILIGILAATTSGCAYTGSFHDYLENGLKVGPEYRKPLAEVEANWIDSYDQRILSELPRHNEWWHVFNDPQLDLLVSEAYVGNLSLKEAGLRVMESRAELGIAVGSLLPQQQQFGGDYKRRQISKTAIENRPLIATRVPRAFDRFTIGFDAAWELDVWGKFRRNVEAADASLDANIEEYDDILVSLLAETAAAYAEMRTAQERLRLAKANVEAQKGTLSIAESRYKAGETDEMDVYQARTNVKNTEALIPSFEELERKAQIRLCVLLGMPPRDLTPELGEGPIPTAPTMLELGIPADLLRRRPDVRRAEREVAAQCALIGAAAADLLPQFSIKGNINYSSRKFTDLFNNSSLAGVLAPGFSWNVLNYGRIANNVRVQDARFQQRVVRYRETVLKANADVERAAVSFLKGQERVSILKEAVAANVQALDIATDQYRAGEINFNQIFTLQAYLVQEQDALAEAEGDVVLAFISVYKALGGGWEIRLNCPTETIVVEPLPATDAVIEAEDAPEVLLPPTVDPPPLPPTPEPVLAHELDEVLTP